MTHLLRLALLSTTAISLGGVIFADSLTGEIISERGGPLIAPVKATILPAASTSDFPICQTQVERTHTVLRLAQARTEVPPNEMKAVMPAPEFANSEAALGRPWLHHVQD
jgi:hypothetical protein